jgi:diguanylate cyclase (GGDEF)-like protein
MHLRRSKVPVRRSVGTVVSAILRRRLRPISPLVAVPPVGEDTDRPEAPIADGGPELDLLPRDRPALTVLAGSQAGCTFPLDPRETLVGRSGAAAVCIADLGVSRRHARIVRATDGTYSIEDLGSSNGTFVEGRRVTRAPLTSGARVHLGSHVRLRFALLDAIEAGVAQDLYASSTLDPLTGVHNRRSFRDRLRHEISYAHRNRTPLGLVAVDVDHFKRVNDVFGHAAGDALLVSIARQLMGQVRDEDVVARVGGEEFAILARGVARDGLRVLAERLRRTVERSALPFGAHELRATASLGFALLEDCTEGDPASGLVQLADAQVYAAKALGRNRVCG